MLSSVLHHKILAFFENFEYEGKKFSGQPKVILLDVLMPKVDGMQVLHKLKSNIATKRIPVVMMPTKENDSNVKICMELGADDTIVKPVDYQEFLKVVVSIGEHWGKLNQ